MDESGPTNEELAENHPSVALRPCRRCRNLFDQQMAACPVCGAANAEAATIVPAVEATGSVTDRALLVVCVCYGVVLISHVLWGLGVSKGAIESPMSYALSMVVIDSIFVTVVIIAAWMTRSLRNTPEPTEFPVLAWVLGLPLLLLALGGNFAYHRVLISFFGIPVVEGELSRFDSLTVGIVLLCVEPALVEEFFFRGIAWKSLRAHMGPYATVLVTSAMFGLAHIGVPLSVPALFGIGIVLGCLRLWSGSLVLPMIAHFVHNLVILLCPEL